MRSKVQTLSLVVTIFGLAASVVLAVMLTRELQADARVRDTLSLATATVDRSLQQQAGLTAEVEELARQTEERRVQMLLLLPPAERARTVVGPLVARIKADHAAHPRPRRPLPIPPILPSRMLPPEIRDDPVYLRAEFMGRRSLLDWQFRERVSAAGLPDATVERVLDLLTEHAMVDEDLLVTARDSSGNVDSHFMEIARTQKAEIAETLRALVGEQVYETLWTSRRTFNLDPVTQVKTWRIEKTLGGITDGKWRLQALSARLSYSMAPLNDQQRQSMIAALGRADLAGEDLLTREGRLAPAFVAIAKASLRPEQLGALAELEAEAQAAEKRRRLPKIETTPGKR